MFGYVQIIVIMIKHSQSKNINSTSVKKIVICCFLVKIQWCWLSKGKQHWNNSDRYDLPKSIHHILLVLLLFKIKKKTYLVS